ncbi:uroporphyrinogen-III synthase [Nitratiruptor sp. YY09-18]|uniref:uroporphyrinogen-III synthase n=1 Tax=Nitratiruptor sp. YY09-18 TaxID=2724901 RepID=UPI001915A50F|nr:uroporphyrinogen-III synthase [Nitratiruptor sp. YY09-18]BCD67675.1 uroporphyrinogen-III synthase [Nitratiruptor sp. YY09-18]
MDNIYILSQSNVEGAKRLPLIRQKFFSPSISLDKYDYLIFTSKNSVKALEQIDPSWKKIPAFAIGKATAKMIENFGGKVINSDYAFYGQDFAMQIEQYTKEGRRLLFPRAKVVVTPLGEILRKRGMEVDEVIVYETLCSECKELEPPPKDAHIIFSSPSTIQCFFRCFSWDPSYKAYAIGKKSAQVLPKDVPYTLFEGKSLQEIIDCIRKNKV